MDRALPFATPSQFSLHPGRAISIIHIICGLLNFDFDFFFGQIIHGPFKIPNFNNQVIPHCLTFQLTRVGHVLNFRVKSQGQNILSDLLTHNRVDTYATLGSNLIGQNVLCDLFNSTKEGTRTCSKHKLDQIYLFGHQ